MTLGKRLGIALFVVLIAMGAALAVGSRYAANRYFQEVNQELNSSIAMYVVGRLQLLSNGGEVNQDSLKALADQAMTVNPSVEVYLTDNQGKILAHALPAETVLMTHIDLAPVQRFLTPNAKYPIVGDDPRNPNVTKTFSAHPIHDNDNQLGYLYVVLGGKQFDSALAMFSDSYVLRLASLVMLATLFVALVLGLWLVRRHTQPLTELQAAVRKLGAAGFGQTTSTTDATTLATIRPTTDEVGWLKNDIESMIDKLSDQYSALDANDRLRRELVANVSHDLRTPLSSIQGYLETLLLKDQSLSPRERFEFISVAHRHSKQLSRLISELFELAQLDSGSVSLSQEIFSLTELLQDVVQEFQLQAAELDIALTVTGTNIHVLGDIGLIQRVLENLVLNALRYTPHKGEIRLDVSSVDGQALISVSDNGCGIAANELPLIFDRYYRATQDINSTQIAGSPNQQTDNGGLGLAIVKRILELHGSEIRVSSEVDKGTTFEFALATG